MVTLVLVNDEQLRRKVYENFLLSTCFQCGTSLEIRVHYLPIDISLNLMNCCRWGRTLMSENVGQIFIKFQSTRVIYRRYKTWIFRCSVVSETSAYNYMIINESDCHLHATIVPFLKTFQRNVFRVASYNSSKKNLDDWFKII